MAVTKEQLLTFIGSDTSKRFSGFQGLVVRHPKGEESHIFAYWDKERVFAQHTFESEPSEYVSGNWEGEIE